MTNVKLKATLPKDEESNGLGAAAVATFLAEPRKPQVAIVVLQRDGYDHDDATMQDVPKVRILRAEIVTDGEEASDLVKRAQALSEVRTGNTALPGLRVVADESSALDFDPEPAA